MARILFLFIRVTLVLLNPDLSFLENTVDPEKPADLGSTLISVLIENIFLQLECWMPTEEECKS